MRACQLFSIRVNKAVDLSNLFSPTIGLLIAFYDRQIDLIIFYSTETWTWNHVKKIWILYMKSIKIVYFVNCSLKPNAKIADPICTFVFSVIVLITTIPILRDVLSVLMEGWLAIIL